MRANERLAGQLQRALSGEAWHGPALLELLQGLDLAAASRRPMAGVHSIAELARHALAWQQFVERRLEGEPWRPATDAEDWPQPPATDPEWLELQQGLRTGGARLAAAIGALPDTRLDEIVPGAQHSFETMLQGLVQHHLYHAGQIALLKRA